MVCMWKVKADKGTDFIPLECLRGHTSSVTALTASRSNSILVSGSESAIVWDLNRMKYVRSLMGHENGVQLVCINDSTGDIITCSGHVIRVWTINGELLLSKSTGSSSEPILSCVFYEERPKEWSGKEQIITGHKKGIIKFWIKEVSLDPKTGRHRWNLTLVRQIQQMNRTHEIPDVSDIVLLKFTGPKRTLLSGNTLGQVYSYVLPDTTDTVHYVKEDRCRECMFCTKTFSVLGKKYIYIYI
ncbi:WD40-repeat-containing domain protein [Phycomyces blakesleeanus]|uniref:WD40-repeat-containing domain protein n=1 Tax=Phycomyces blakesleeanus TaxID=4837 RepID=A0ABR3BCW2_PHYBL